MSAFERWMAQNGDWDVTEGPELCNTEGQASKRVNCQRVRRFRYSWKRYRVTESPPILHTFLFPFPESLENGGYMCNCVTERAKIWKPFRFHAGDAFEGFPLQWSRRQNAKQIGNFEATLQRLRIIPRDEVLQSANIARRQRSRELLAMMYETNVDDWTWCEHPGGIWRAHHSIIFGGASENI